MNKDLNPCKQLLGAQFDRVLMDALQSLVDNETDNRVVDYVKHADKKLAQGFSLKPQNAPKFRERIKQKIAASSEIKGSLHALLQQNRKLRYPAPLSLDFLNLHLPAILHLYGREKMLVSLLLDERKELNDIAIDAIANSLPAATDDAVIEAYKSATRSLAEGLLQDLHEDFVPEEKTAGTDDKALRAAETKAAALEEQKAKLERKLEESVATSKEMKAKLNVAEPAAAKVPCLEADLETAKAEISALKAQLKRTEAELAEIRDDQEQAVLSLVRKELEAYSKKWVAGPEEFEAACRETARLTGDADVIARAREVMARQREIDRQSGNRGKLLERLKALQSTMAEAMNLASDAITPLPALAAIIEDLEREAKSISAKLGLDARATDPVALAQTRMALADDPEALQRIKQWLDLMDEMELAGPAAMQKLYAAYHARVSLLYDTRQMVTINRATAPRNPLWHLQQGLADNEAMMLLLDGYNVILTLPDIFGVLDPDKSPGEAVRSMLTDQLQRIGSHSPACEISVYFDGPVAGARTISPRVKVIFSGGTGDHRADRAIIDDLEHLCRERSAVPRILVTSDRELGASAVELGAQVVRVNEFAEFLQAGQAQS